MESRLSRLEADFVAMRADLSAVRADTSYIRGKVESLPTAWQMITVVLAGNITLAGTLFAAAKIFGHS